MLRLEMGLYVNLTRLTCDKLEASGIRSIIQFVTTDLEQLSIRCGVSYRDLLSIKRYLLAKHSSPLVNAAKLYEELMESSAILPFGIESLDKLMDGGLYTGELVQICGPTGSGKTQLCLSASLSVAADLHKRVIYLDCCGDFNPSHLYQVLQQRNLFDAEIKSALENITLVRITDMQHLLEELHSLKITLAESCGILPNEKANGVLLRLLVLDSITQLMLTFKPCEAIGYVKSIAFMLKSLSVEYSFAVLATVLLEPSIDRSFSDMLPNVLLEVSEEGMLDSDSSLIRVRVGRSVRCATGWIRLAVTNSVLHVTS